MGLPRRGLTPGRLAVALLVVAGLVAAWVVGVRLLDRITSAEGAVSAHPVAGPSPVGATGGEQVPGRDVPGVHVQVSPRADGTLDVVEEVRFLGGATGLQISLPTVTGVVARVRPTSTRITELEVLVDGRRLPMQQESLATGGRVLLPTAPLAVRLTYRLVGAATVSTPSTPGRALVLLPPITDDDSLTRLPVVIEVRGPGVRNLVCPGLPTSDELCGRETSTGWRTVSLPPRVTAVLAQLDLSSY